MGFHLLDCPFKPTLLLSHALSDSLSLYVPSDSFLSPAPSNSTPFLPGHLFITSAVGGERVRRCQPKTFRSMSVGGGGHFHRTGKSLQKVLIIITTILAQSDGQQLAATFHPLSSSFSVQNNSPEPHLFLFWVLPLLRQRRFRKRKGGRDGGQRATGTAKNG